MPMHAYNLYSRLETNELIQPTRGVRITVPELLTQTQTLLHRKSLVTGVPSSITIAFTFGFSFSTLAAAASPASPTSSGHEFLPAAN